MATLQWKKFIGQERIKKLLSSACSGDTLGHAYLFCGDTGVGMFTAALEMAMALLCTQNGERPCYNCSACKKVLAFCHPDFHVVMPLALEKEHKGSDGKISDAGWDEIVSRVTTRINDPYAINEFASPPSIPVEWVRETIHAAQRGAVEKGKNVFIVDGIDTMQAESANTMLKTLEEPPAGTVFILCTSRVQVVLPTIVSRCQIIRFPLLSPEEITRALSDRYHDDPRLCDAATTGSLGKALRLMNDTETSGSMYATEFIECIASRDMMALFEMIDRLSAIDDYNIYEELFLKIMNSARNTFFSKIGESGNYIMGESFLPDTFGAIATPLDAESLVHLCEGAIRRIRLRVNSSLVLANFAFSVMECIDE